MIEDFLQNFTYAGLFLALFAGGLGAPIPEEVVLIRSGALSQQDVVRWWLALPVCLAGVLVGDIVLYWAGHHWGDRIRRWPLVRLVMTPALADALKHGYRLHAAKIIFTARHVVGLRAAAFLTAGTARVPFWKFIIIDGAAALISVPVGFGLGYLFTDQLFALLAGVHRVERWLGVLALLAAAAALVYIAWNRGRHID